MSNYHSIIHNYGQPQSTFDANLAVQALSYKQGKYDANAAKIQEALNTYGNIELARPEDREYLYQRLNSLVNNIKGLKGADLASNNITSQIMGHVSKALDERVVKQYGNTQKIKNFQAQMQEKQTKKPEAWDVKNYEFALEQAGFYDYMNGQDAQGNKVDDLGNLAYRDFVDLGKERRDIALNLHKFTDVIKETTPEGVYFVTKTGDRLTKEQARRIIETQITDKARGQMEINAWSTYEKNMSEEELNSRFNTFSQNNLKGIDAAIADIDLKLKNANTEDKREELTATKKDWLDYKQNKERSYNEASKRAKALALEEEDFFGGFANTYFKDPKNYKSVEFSANSAELQRQRELSKSAKEAATGLTENGDPLFGVVPGKYTPEESLNLYDNTLKSAQKNDEIYKHGVKNLFNQLDSETKNQLEAGFETKKEDYDSFEDYLFDKFDEFVTKDKSSNVITIEQLENVRLAKDLAEADYKKFNTARAMAFENLETAGVSKIFEVVQSNKNIPIVDESGKRVSARDWLQQKGINSTEDLENNPEVKKALLKQYYADMALSESNIGERVGQVVKTLGSLPFGGLPSPNTLGGVAANMAILKTPIKNNLYRDRLIDLVGEEEANRYLQQVEQAGAYDTNKFSDFSTTLSSVPTLGFSNLLNPDNSFEDDSTTRNLITQDKVKGAATKIMNEQGEMFGRPVNVIINPNSSAWQSMANYIASDATSEFGDMSYIVDSKSPITLRVLDADTVELSSVTMNTKDGQKVPQPQGKVILKSSLPPVIQNNINLQTSKALLTNKTFPKMESRVEYGDATDIKRVNDIARTIFAGDQNAVNLAFTTTKEQTLGNIYNQFSQVVGTQDNPTQVGQIINRVIDSDDFVVRTNNIDGQVYKEIWYSGKDPQGNKKERKLFTESTPVREDVLDHQYKMVKYAPQLVLNFYLTKILNEINGGRYSNDFQKLKDIYAAQ